MNQIQLKQCGFTLIELMIGLVIAVLCMLMMLMMFKQVSQISMSSSTDAEYEAQLQTGMLVMEKFIQSAGFGSGKAADVAIGTQLGNPAIFWRFNPDLDASPVTYECQGVAEEIKTENGRKIHRLILIQKDNCGDGTHQALTEGNWQESQAITSIQNTSASPIFNYALSDGDCRPFGIDKMKAGSKQLTLSAARAHLTDSNYTLKTVICLNNIKATA